MPKSLVTGVHGFLGRYVADALVARGDEVVGLDVAAGGREGVGMVEADLRDRDAVARAIEGVDTVWHCASLVHTKRNRVETVKAVNIDGTRNVIDGCIKAGVKKMVYVSSASVVYEGQDIENGDERLPYAKRFPAPYAETKMIAEKAVLAANGQQGLLTVAIRPHVVFGPGDRRFIPAIVSRAREGKLRFSVAPTDKLSDFTYVTNVVDAMLAAEAHLAPDSRVAGRAYFITNGEPTPFWDFIRRVVEPLGHPAPVISIPYRLAYAAAFVRETIDSLRGGTLHAEEGLSRFAIRYLCTHHYFSHARATEDFGYRPRVSIQQGIERTVEALKNS